MDDGGDSFSEEAVRSLLTEVENNRTGLMVIMAGYKTEMGKLMRADPGPSCVPRPNRALLMCTAHA